MFRFNGTVVPFEVAILGGKGFDVDGDVVDAR
jgi:hypothetical protein